MIWLIIQIIISIYKHIICYFTAGLALVWFDTKNYKLFKKYNRIAINYGSSHAINNMGYYYDIVKYDKYRSIEYFIMAHEINKN